MGKSIMGKGYDITGDTRAQALERAIAFMHTLKEKHGRRAEILGILQSGSTFTALVDVCGRPSLTIAKLAKSINQGKVEKND